MGVFLYGWGCCQYRDWDLLACQIKGQRGSGGKDHVAPPYPACSFGSVPCAEYLAAAS